MRLSVQGRYERSKTSTIFCCYVNIFSHLADAGRIKERKLRKAEGGRQAGMQCRRQTGYGSTAAVRQERRTDRRSWMR